MNSTFVLKKVNNVEVVPLKGAPVDKRPHLCDTIFSEPLPVCYLAAKRKSGKSVLLQNILDYITEKSVTTIRIFSETIAGDFQFKHYITERKKEGFIIETFNQVYQTDKKGNKINILAQQLHEIDDFVLNKDKMKRFMTTKYQWPLVIYIFDDFRLQMKEVSLINDMATRSRHYRIALFYSSQKYKDVTNAVRINLTNLVLFKNMREEDLDTIHKEIITPAIKFDTFMSIYLDATKDKFCFLFIDVEKQIFRKNLNMEYQNILQNAIENFNKVKPKQVQRTMKPMNNTPTVSYKVIPGGFVREKADPNKTIRKKIVDKKEIISVK